MNKEKEIELRIAQLKDEKENLKFGFEQFSSYLLQAVVMIAAAGVAAISAFQWVIVRVVILIGCLVLIMLAYLKFNPELKSRGERMKEKAKQIKAEYAKLLKEKSDLQ